LRTRSCQHCAAAGTSGSIRGALRGGTQRASAGTLLHVALERSGGKLELSPTPASISFAAPVLTRAKIDAIIEETATANATKRGRAASERRKPALHVQLTRSCLMMRRELNARLGGGL
jgi:hypothetical protein